MTDPWGLSGPAFLAIYAVLLVTPIVLNLLWARQQHRARGPARADVGLYELAMAAGGARRAAETALAVLLDRGDLRVSGAGMLTRVAGAERPPHPVEQAIFEAADRRRIGYLIRRITERPEFADLSRASADAGLIVRTARRRVRRVVVLLVALAVLGIGVARFVLGPRDGYAVDLLGVMLIPAAILAAVTGWQAVRNRPARTRRAVGELAVQRRKETGSAAVAVLLGGLVAHPDDAVRTTAGTSGGSTGNSASSAGGGCAPSWHGGGGCGGGGD